MSTLYLIRHGQASFGAADYDLLSERGCAQSRLLGSYFAGRGQALDAVYSGPRKRQIGSAEHFLAAAGQAGVSYPEPICVDELDEYPAFEIMRACVPVLAAADPALGQLVTGNGSGGGHAGHHDYERAFGIVLKKWVLGEVAAEALETFVRFRERVHRGLGHIKASQGRNKQIAVFTSGGPISLAMQLALGFADETTLRIAWVTANSSVSEFRYRQADELTLVRFNGTPHLQDDELITYR